MAPFITTACDRDAVFDYNLNIFKGVALSEIITNIF